MKQLQNQQQGSKGMSLIELMIALVIGLLLTLAAMGLFVSNKRVYKEQNYMGRLQENARFATELLIRDIRMAGYSGCSDDITKVTNHITGYDNDDNLISFSNAVEGSENAASWKPSGSAVTTLNPAMVAGTDGITVRYLEPSGITMIPPYMTVSAATVHVNAGNGLAQGDIVAVSDCSSADVFQITNNNPDTSGSVVHNTGAVVTPGNWLKNLSKTYGGDAQFLRLVANRYYIGNSATGIPGLYRVQNAGAPQELIEGVERLQILYGEDTGTDTIADQYVTAAAVADWDKVVSVQIALLMMTVEQNFHGDPDTGTYTLLNAAAYNPADDYHHRRLVTSTVQIRNRTN